MDIKKIFQLLMIMSLFSVSSLIIAKFTYKSLNQRVQTIYNLEPDFFTLDDDVPFNYRQELYTVVSNVRFGKFKIYNDTIIDCEKIRIKNGYRPITIDNKFDKYIIELIGQKIEINENCINNILKVVSENFYNNVRKKIKLIRSNKNYLLEILNKSDQPNVDTENYNIASVSILINLIENGEIKDLSLGNNYSISVDKKDIKYLTFVNGEVKKILISSLINSQINFSVVSPSVSVTDNYKVSIERTLLEDDLSVKKLETHLKNNPFIINSISNKYVKISENSYILSILILMNIIGIIIFLILNKSYFYRLIKSIN